MSEASVPLACTAWRFYRIAVVGLMVVLTLQRVGAAHSESSNQNRTSEKNQTASHRYQLAVWDFKHVEIPYVICLWVLLASVTKIGFHLYNRLSKIFPESCLLIVLGILVGVILHFSHAATTEQYVLDANTFFLFLLPPIIYDAGYHMPNRAFFNNLGTILVLAVVNTVWNTVAIAVSIYGCSYVGWISRKISLLHCFVFSAFISAVDPVAVLAVFEEVHVNEMLYIIVFGESLLNDGVTVVIYHMMEGYTEIGEENLIAVDYVAGVGSFFIVVLGGTLIGIIYGFIGGFITKYTDHVRVIEPLFVFVLGYLAYLTAEMVHLSSILALTFGGITMRHYVEANMSKKSITTVKYFLKMLANISETVIFMFLGLSTVVDSHDWQFDFICFSVIFCIVYRVLGVMFLSFVVNRTRLIRLTKIDQFIMSYGGLRGGIAFCLSLLVNEERVPEKRMFVTTTIIIVFFTVFVQGITIKPVVNALKVKRAETRERTVNELLHERLMDHLMAGIEDIVGKSGHNSFKEKFEYYNARFIQPLLLREKPKHRERGLIENFTKLSLKDASDYISTYGNFPHPQLQPTPSMGALLQEPSLAKLLRNYSQVSLAESQGSEQVELGGRGDHIPQTATVLDMQSVEAVYSKKQADDSVMHHFLEDAMFRPRKTFSVVKRHTLTEEHNHPPFRHKERFQLRRFISQAYKSRHHHSSHAHSPGSGGASSQEMASRANGTPGSKTPQFLALPKPGNSRPRKAVSFSDVKREDSTEALVKSGLSSGGDSDEDHRVTFTLGASNADGAANSDSSPTSPDHHETVVERTLPWNREPEVQVVPVVETEAERVLPWNRPTGMEQPVRSFASLTMQEEDYPLMSEAPSWANNPAYHHLKESGSPYTSPQTTVVVQENAARRPIFDLFPLASDKVKVEQQPPEVPPPPWSAANLDDEPLPSPSITVSSADKLTHVHSTHNLIPPTHRVFVSPDEEHHHHPDMMHRLSVTDSLAIASTPDSPKHFPLLERDTVLQHETEKEIIAECAGYQEEVQSRVSEWLKLSDQGSGGEEADIDEEKSPEDRQFTYRYDSDTEESDVETSHL